MKKTLIYTFGILTLGLLSFVNHNGGGIYKTNTGNISFYSHTVVEDISAENHKVKTAFDAGSGKIQFSVLVKDFEFPKALMQEHFNENYMQSTKFPKSTFSGTIENVKGINFEKDGTYTSPVSGSLTIKGTTKKVSTIGTFVVTKGVVNAKATFNVNPVEYGIKIPKGTTEKISDAIQVSIDADYKHAH